MRTNCWLIAVVVSLAVVGCGPGKNTAAVSGRVTYKSKTVANADVTFTPEATGGKPAGGRTDASGYYKLTTATNGDGAMLGKYKVHIIARGPERPPKPGEAITGMPGEMMPGDPLIPQKYFAADTSGLSFEVKRGSNSANFDLPD